jgi:cytidylate kinase
VGESVKQQFSEVPMAILTTSRQFGSGNREIVQAIMASMHYRYVDKDVILKEIRAKGGKWERWAQELDESSPAFWDKYDRSFKGFGALLQEILLRYALQDNVILRGRGANFLMEGIPHAYRIRVVCSLEDRIERVTHRESIDRKTARWLIEDGDRERAGFVHALYGKDVNDPRYYDTVFRRGDQSLDEIIEIVKQTLLARDRLKTDAAQRLLSMRAVSAKIKATLIMDPRLYVPILDVVNTETEIVLRGIVRNSDQYRRIVDAARELSEDFPLEVELRYRA